jgi:cytochrome c
MTRPRVQKCILVAAIAALAAFPAFADETLAKKASCTACHSVDTKIVGPAFKDVAAKYRGDDSAEAKLVLKVKKGGAGVWGPMPMPPSSPPLKDEDAKALVKWILSLK